jgi:hypothetical protein
MFWLLFCVEVKSIGMGLTDDSFLVEIEVKSNQ